MAAKVWIFIKRPWALAGIGALAVVIAVIAVRVVQRPKYELATVERGTVTAEVSLTGKVEPAKELFLSFEKTGRVVRVYKDVGDAVYAGETIVSLAASDLAAQLASASANVDAARAKLDGLRKGARPEELAIKQTALDQAKLTLANFYASLPTTLENGLINAQDAVQKQTDPLFSNDDQDPVLSFATTDLQAKNDAEAARVNASREIAAWKSELAVLTDPGDADLAKAKAHLLAIQGFLKTVNDALQKASNLSATTLATYQTALTTGRTEVSTSLASVSTAVQSIAAEKLAVAQAENDLALAKAGSTPESIRAQEAAVNAAAADAEKIQAEIAKTAIRAPISGIITEQDAKEGQTAAAQAAMVKMISAGKFQVEAQVAETDVSRVALGKPVDLTFDALPEEHFTGRVVSIDPGETVLEGVATYKTKVGLDSVDSRIKPGMTANMDILVDKHDNVLLLPQRAVSSEDGKKYVTLVVSGKKERREVRTGLRGQDGQVEILSGLAEGDTVLRSGE